uniref:Uncharacterized protein n=1 Tax=Romanomermis culicivorax TaxID=13658 RepID=A0A915HSK6_ROMCU
MLKYPKEVLEMNLHEYLAMTENNDLIENIDKDIDSRINEKLRSVHTKPPLHSGREATPLEKFRAPKPNENVVYSVRGSLILLDRRPGDRYNSSKKPRAIHCSRKFSEGELRADVHGKNFPRVVLGLSIKGVGLMKQIECVYLKRIEFPKLNRIGVIYLSPEFGADAASQRSTMKVNEEEDEQTTKKYSDLREL